jgi:hypothetical protein
MTSLFLDDEAPGEVGDVGEAGVGEVVLGSASNSVPGCDWRSAGRRLLSRRRIWWSAAAVVGPRLKDREDMVSPEERESSWELSWLEQRKTRPQAAG